MQGLWHFMETPTFTTRHICTENYPPPSKKKSILWTTVSSSIGKIFSYIIITFLNIHAYRLVSFFHPGEVIHGTVTLGRDTEKHFIKITATQLHYASGTKRLALLNFVVHTSTA